MMVRRYQDDDLESVATVFTGASVTARPFFERMGFSVLRKQQVEFSGVIFKNYAMEKQVPEAGQPYTTTRKTPPALSPRFPIHPASHKLPR